MLPLLSPAQMTALDRHAIEQLGVPALVLMESAASACVRVLLDAFPSRVRRGVHVLAGPGNNGADGLAIARRLVGLGAPASVELPLGAGAGDAQTQEKLARASGVRFDADGARDGVLVDALFGTGLARPLDGAVLARLEALAGDTRPVLAVDIPSGVDGRTGQILGAAVHAQHTVTFGLPKLGHLQGPGRWARGALTVADIGIPARLSPELFASAPRLLDRSALESRSGRDPGGHKGSFGHVLVVAGSAGKMGAARLCAEAALRGGAGLVTLCVPDGVALDSLAGIRPEVMVERAPSEEGCFADPSVVLELLSTRDALALGPGLGNAPALRAFIQALLDVGAPTVLDADGLNRLGALASWVPARGPLIITPHPGEAARLLERAVGAIEDDRLAAARALGKGRVAVLKGAGTLIAAGNEAWLNPTGNAGMATGGTGDVLTGILAALLAQGLPAASAARTGVFWHGLAGDLAASRLGAPCLLAGDLLDSLGAALEARPDLSELAGIRLDPPGWSCAP